MLRRGMSRLWLLGGLCFGTPCLLPSSGSYVLQAGGRSSDTLEEFVKLVADGSLVDDVLDDTKT